MQIMSQFCKAATAGTVTEASEGLAVFGDDKWLVRVTYRGQAGGEIDFGRVRLAILIGGTGSRAG